MPRDVFTHVVLPVADSEDARSTAQSARPHIIEADGTVVAVHVIEKAGGAPDKASVEQRQQNAESIFDSVRDELPGLDVKTRIAYGTDIVEAIFDVAADVDASAIVFTPRSGGRWIRLLTGDVALSMITETDRPVVVLPDEPAETDETENAQPDGARGNTE